MRTTVAGICVFLFFTMSLLSIYQIGATGGVLKGGYVMMANYYMSTFGDRPASFILADASERSSYSTTILVRDRRARNLFRSRLGEENVRPYGEQGWMVSGVKVNDFFRLLQGMEMGILAIGSVLVISMVLPLYFDSRST